MLNLTEKQSQAVLSRKKNICVVASAGTGKTSVLVNRYIDLVLRRKVNPENILALTFTRKAANEMKERLINTFEKGGHVQWRMKIENAYIGTIDGFASKIIKDNIFSTDLDPEFYIADDIFCTMEKNFVINNVLNRYAESNIDEKLKISELFGERFADVIGAFFDKLRQLGKNEECVGEFSDVLTADIEETYRDIAGMLEGGNIDIHQIIKGSIKKEDVHKLHQKLKSNGYAAWQYLSVLETVKKKRVKKEHENTKKEFDGLVEKYRLQAALRIFENMKIQNHIKEILSDIKTLYRRRKQELKYIDFQDLLDNCRKIFVENPFLADKYHEMYKHILVDEYQDTNTVQSEIIKTFLKGENTQFFIVGDKKQSIYGFRDAQTSEFTSFEKESKADKEGELIELDTNFRSRENLVNFTNTFFGRLWGNDSDDFHPVKPSIRETEENPQKPVKILLVQNDGENQLKADQLRRLEAKNLARFIRDSVSKGTLKIHDSGTNYRKMDYKDITILFRSLSSLKIYERALNKYGIPFVSISGKGFFAKREIEDIFNFLKVINHPNNDLSLLALLRSPLYGISLDAVYWLSTLHKGILLQLLRQGPPPEITGEDKSSIEECIKLYTRIIKNKNTMGLQKIISLIYTECHVCVKYLSREDFYSRQTYANLKKLEETAFDFEQKFSSNIDEFIKYFHNAKMSDPRIGEAMVESEDADAVKLMTVHAAKGLEFPCIVLADLEHKRQNTLKSEGIIYEKNEDIAYSFKNPMSGNAYQTSNFEERANTRHARDEDELMRLLYVAMTRAKDYLVFSGIRQETYAENPRRKSNKWADLICSTLELMDDSGSQYAEIIFADEKVHIGENNKKRPMNVSELLKKIRPLPARQDAGNNQKIVDEVARIINLIEKPLPASSPEEITVSATDISDWAYCPMRYYLRLIKQVPEHNRTPQMIIKDNDRPDRLLIGNIVHNILEHIDLKDKNCRETAGDYIDRINGASESEKKITRRILAKFFKSGEYQALLESRRIYKELPFMIKENDLIIRGTIDNLYQNDKGDYIILDYKTHNIRAGEVEGEGKKAEAQILTYALAFYRITGILPKEAKLLFLTPEKTYRTPIDQKVLDKFCRGLEQMAADIRSGVFGKKCDDAKICGFKDICTKV